MGEGTLGTASDWTGLIWPGKEGQRYFSLEVLKGMGPKAEACHSSKIMWLLNKSPCPFSPNLCLWSLSVGCRQWSPTCCWVTIASSRECQSYNRNPVICFFTTCSSRYVLFFIIKIIVKIKLYCFPGLPLY